MCNINISLINLKITKIIFKDIKNTRFISFITYLSGIFTILLRLLILLLLLRGQLLLYLYCLLLSFLQVCLVCLFPFFQILNHHRVLFLLELKLQIFFLFRVLFLLFLCDRSQYDRSCDIGRTFQIVSASICKYHPSGL